MTWEVLVERNDNSVDKEYLRTDGSMDADKGDCGVDESSSSPGFSFALDDSVLGSALSPPLSSSSCSNFCRVSKIIGKIYELKF